VNKRITLSSIPWVVWILTSIALPCWLAVDGQIAWDLDVMIKAAHSLHAGTDPYLDGIARQDQFLSATNHAAGTARPFVYVYSPATLPLLKLAVHLPKAFMIALYWVLYSSAILLQCWVVSHLPDAKEKLFAAALIPITLFFPGLLLFDSVFSGNIAFLLYSFMLGGFWLGWKRQNWLWFYVAVLVASCFKPPYLVYCLLPLFCCSRRWWNTAITAVLGLALFAVQPLIWPTQFHNYMRAIDRIFSYNNDFGSGPAGRIGALLALTSANYGRWGTIVYLLLSVGLFAFLIHLSRFYKKGNLTCSQWFPLMLLGVLLLNPRLIEYDIFPFTLPMVLVLVRLVRPLRYVWQTAAMVLVLWITANYFANQSHECWKKVECVILLLLFAGGAMQVVRHTNAASKPVLLPVR